MKEEEKISQIRKILTEWYEELRARLILLNTLQEALKSEHIRGQIFELRNILNRLQEIIDVVKG